MSQSPSQDTFAALSWPILLSEQGGQGYTLHICIKKANDIQKKKNIMCNVTSSIDTIYLLSKRSLNSYTVRMRET